MTLSSSVIGLGLVIPQEGVDVEGRCVQSKKGKCFFSRYLNMMYGTQTMASEEAFQ